jgi:hypothetical protein
MILARAVTPPSPMRDHRRARVIGMFLAGDPPESDREIPGFPERGVNQGVDLIAFSHALSTQVGRMHL